MKGNKKLLPIVLYPYLYMVCFGILVLITPYVEDVAIGVLIVLLLGIAVTVYCIIMGAKSISAASKGKLDGLKFAKLNLITKSVHVLSYIIHFALGIISLIMGVWGIGILFYVIIIDFLTIMLSGLIGVASAIACKKESRISDGICILYSILSFFYVVDFIMAIVLWKNVKKEDSNHDCNTQGSEPQDGGEILQ